MEQRRCPNCEVGLPIGTAIRFDSRHNVLCPECGKPLLPVVSQAENQVTPKAGVNVKAVHNTYGPTHNPHSHYNINAVGGAAQKPRHATAEANPAYRPAKTSSTTKPDSTPCGPVELYEHYMD